MCQRQGDVVLASVIWDGVLLITERGGGGVGLA